MPRVYTHVDLDEQAHALEVVLLNVSEVETRNDNQLLAKGWAAMKIRERAYELRAQAAKLRSERLT